jgi:hypothetical protein
MCKPMLEPARARREDSRTIATDGPVKLFAEPGGLLGCSKLLWPTGPCEKAIYCAVGTLT